jgi:hypothetical protein
MRTGTALATTLFAIASFPLMAQQSPATNQPDSPAAQQSPAGAETATPNSAAASPAGSAAEMSSINGELVSKLDSKTAKTGDSVVVQTKSATKTADGTAIPKGSKLVGHVVGAQSSGGSENSQLALLFDHIELKGGQSVPVHSQVQSVSPAGGAASAGVSAPMSGPPAGGSSPSANGASGSGSAASPQGTGAAPAASSGPAAGTVVAKTGQIAISTTSIPGVLLANNAQGQQDPRMARTSSILLGAKQDIELDSGTQMVVGVSAAGAGTQ